MRSAWNVRVAGWISPGRPRPTARSTIATSSAVVRTGDSLRAETIALAMARERRSSPKRKMTSARTRSPARLTKSAALGPSAPMRMSSGPSFWKEKPRSGRSICIDETPMSRTTPSAGANPIAAAILSMSE